MVVETLSHRSAPASNFATPQQNVTSTAGTLLNTSRAPSVSPSIHQGSMLSSATPLVYSRTRSVRSRHRENLRVKRAALNAKLLLARNKFEKEVVALGKEYHKSPYEVKAQALLKNKFGVMKRRVNSYNAFRHMQSKARSKLPYVYTYPAC
jgi:hypothetical protein